MTQAFARVDEHPVQSITVHVPAIGPWWAEVVFEGAPLVSGRASIWLGGLELVGTIDPTHDGIHGLQRRARIVAGAGAWASPLEPRAYHNDAQVRARTVAEDAAREAGEQLGDFVPSVERIGIDYVRQAGPASRALEDVIGDAAWWVGYDGRTHVGARAAGDAEGYEILEVEPAHRVVTLSCDELDGILVGRTLEGPQLEAPLTIRDLAIAVTEEGVRVRAWCGGTDRSQSRLVDALRSIIARATDGALFGTWRYRVVRRSADRVELQAVRRAPGLPDVLPVSMWPGCAGAHASLAAGAEVLVQFIGGDRREPIVTHFAGKDGVGWRPSTLVLGVHETEGRILLGGPDATEKVSLADRIDPRVDKICNALDAFVAAEPVSNDGGAFIQGALSGVWGMVPHEPVDSGSITVRATRGHVGGPSSGV